MKIRNGFVSNSSSSSFIIGVAKVTDAKKTTAFLNSLPSSCGARIAKVKDLVDDWEVKVKDDSVTVESFSYIDVTVGDVKPEDEVLVIYHTEGDDNDFWDGDCYDYDIDLDFFDPNAIAIFHAILSGDHGLTGGEATYGAGRDG